MAEQGLTVNVYCPDGTVVAIICTQTFAIVGEPNVYNVIFRAGE